MYKQLFFTVLFCSFLFAEQNIVISNTNSPDYNYSLGLKYFNSDDETIASLAFNLFLKAADEGHIDAQVKLGECYYRGIGTKINFTKAIEWYKKAADHGNSDAANNIAFIYKNGNSVAQNEIGSRYRLGLGVTQDFKKAAYWFNVAATNGSAKALYNLGVMYENGLGFTENNTNAFKLFLKSAEQGFPLAQGKVGLWYQRGNVVKQNSEKGFEWYYKAAENGELISQSLLGMCYSCGIGVQTNYIKAIKWQEKFAEQDLFKYFCDNGLGLQANSEKTIEKLKKNNKQIYLYAKYNLALNYQYGNNIPKNITNAFKLFLESADKGYNPAKRKIGLSDNTNSLIELTVLTNLYYMFAEQGNTAAQYNLGLIYYYGSILPEDNNKALKWFLKSAANGYTDSFYRIARIYQIKKNKKAIEWFIKAADAGDYYADYKLGYIYFEGDNIQKDLNKSIKHFQKVIQSPKANDELTGFSHLMTGLIQLKQGKTPEGLTNLKKSIKSSTVKKILTVLTTIGILGGLIFLTSIFLTLFLVLKNNKSFSTKKSWSIVEAVAIMGAFVFLQIGMSVMIIVPFFDKICKDVFLKLLFWTFIGNIIVVFIAVILAKIRPVSVWKQFGFYKIDFKKWFLLVFGGWISVIVFCVIYEWILKLFGIDMEGQMIAQELQKYKNIGSIIFLILIVGFIMPIVEELIFRGVLYQALRSKLSALFSILISSIIFAGIHGDIKYFVPILVTGIVCSYAFEKTKSIYTPIGIHVLNNLFTVSIMIFVSS